MKQNHSNKLPKTELLRSMKATQNKMLAAGVDLRDPSITELSDEIQSIERSFVLYRGQEIDATLVNYISGDITTKGPDLDGDEDLFRDERGRYYLRRRLSHTSREHVHRINLNAAVLWATTRLNCTTLDLCADAADLLQLTSRHGDLVSLLDDNARALLRQQLKDKPGWQPRDVVNGAVTFLLADPEGNDDLTSGTRCVELAKERRLKSGADKKPFTAKQSPATLPGEAVTVPVSLPLALYRQILAMAAYDGRTFSESIANSMAGDVEMWLESGSLAREAGKPNPAQFLADYERELDAARVADMDTPAVVRRDVPLPANDGCQHFTFTYPPKAQVCGLRREVKLDAEQMALAQKLATEFGLTVRAFLKKLVGPGLPGQPRTELAEELEAQYVAFECFDEAMKGRIERAAQAANRTVDAFVASAVGGDVDSYEETMIVHPQTGALLCADHDEVFTTVSHDVTAPPKRGSFLDHPRYRHPQREAGRVWVQFKAWLTPEQIDLLVYPAKGYDADSERSFPEVWIPFDLEGEPQLLVGNRQRMMEEPIPTRETKPPVNGNGHGERHPLEKPVFMLNAPKPKLPKGPRD